MLYDFCKFYKFQKRTLEKSTIFRAYHLTFFRVFKSEYQSDNVGITLPQLYISLGLWILHNLQRSHWNIAYPSNPRNFPFYKIFFPRIFLNNPISLYQVRRRPCTAYILCARKSARNVNGCSISFFKHPLYNVSGSYLFSLKQDMTTNHIKIYIILPNTYVPIYKLYFILLFIYTLQYSRQKPRSTCYSF